MAFSGSQLHGLRNVAVIQQNYGSFSGKVEATGLAPYQGFLVNVGKLLASR